MRKQYYYTLNSLPSLVFGAPPPICSKDFLDMSQTELVAKDFHILESSLIFQVDLEKAPLGVLERWYDWETGIRNKLVSLRAAKLGLDPKEYTRSRGSDPSSFSLAEDAFQTEPPYASEEKLDRARWMFLEELESTHYFDIEKLIIYFLKLQILERRSFFDKKKGAERLVEVVSQVDNIWSKEGKVGFCDG